MDLKQELMKYQDEKGNFNGMKLKFSGLSKLIEEKTAFLNDYAPSNSERYYCILNDVNEVFYCPLTNKKLKFSLSKKAYVNNIAYSRKNNKQIKKFDYRT
jgi:hypothetical protein